MNASRHFAPPPRDPQAPPHRKPRSARRRAVRRHACLFAALTVALAALLADTSFRLADLQCRADAALSLHDRPNRPDPTEARLTAQRDQLAARLALLRDLRPTIRHWQIAAQLGAAIPPTVTLERLDLAAQATESPEPSAQAPQRLEVRLTAFAPSEDQARALLDKLRGDRLFEDVRLIESADAVTHGHEVKRFRISASVALGRRYLPLHAEEASDAR